MSNQQKQDAEGTETKELDAAWQEAWLKFPVDTRDSLVQPAYRIGRMAFVDGIMWADNANKLRQTVMATLSATGRVPHKCPVCDGHGVVAWPEGVAACEPFSTSRGGPWPCLPCNGTGVLWS